MNDRPSDPSSATREHARVRMAQPARLGARGAWQVVRLIDVSATGSRVEVSAPCLADEVTLEWTAVAGLTPLRLAARVLWRKRRVVGLRFAALTDRDRCVLQSLIRHQLNEQGE